LNIQFLKLKVRRLNSDASPLRRGSSQAAGTDIAYCGKEVIQIFPGEVVKLSTGWAFEVPGNVAMQVLPRSGTATKKGLRPANTPGLVDPDYRGQVFVVLENFGNDAQMIYPGDYIAQLMFTPFYKPMFQVEDELSDTKRGDGGFGSTEERGRES
jgi:dUTP pyrophosphatase